MLSQKLHGKSSAGEFPWWIVWVWLGILSSVFFWWWKQRIQGSVIQPVKIDLSFLRHRAIPIAEPARPPEVMIASPTPVENKVEKEPDQPERVSPSKPDDLTVIGGIGPKIVRILVDAGIDTYKRLAQTELVTLQEILQAAHLRLADPESWAAQAQLAADDDWVGLKGYSARRRANRNS